MNKNINLCLDAVRADLRDKRGEYQSGAELMADITKAIFWAGLRGFCRSLEVLSLSFPFDKVSIHPLGHGAQYSIRKSCLK